MGWTFWNSIRSRGRTFSLASGAHPFSYSVGKRRSFLQGKGTGCIMLTTYLHLMLRLGISGAIHLPPHPICLHGVYRDKYTITFYKKV